MSADRHIPYGAYDRRQTRALVCCQNSTTTEACACRNLPDAATTCMREPASATPPPEYLIFVLFLFVCFRFCKQEIISDIRLPVAFLGCSSRLGNALGLWPSSAAGASLGVGSAEEVIYYLCHSDDAFLQCRPPPSLWKLFKTHCSGH